MRFGVESRPLAAAVFLIALVISLPVVADETSTDWEEEPEKRAVNIQYSEVRARISPTFEFGLPTGQLTISFSQLFNNLGLYFYLIEPSFLVDDLFKGSLTEGTVLDEVMDLVPRLSLVYDSLAAPDPDPGTGELLRARGVRHHQGLSGQIHILVPFLPPDHRCGARVPRGGPGTD